MRLEGRKAIVTGAGSDGIGRAVALAFAREGADVVVHHHGDPDAARSVAASIQALGRCGTSIVADFAAPGEARRMMAAAIGFLGDLDILVAAAGTNIRKPLLETTDADWDRVHDVNLKACFACLQEAARHMAARGRPGRIVVISSALQQQVERNMLAYCASKGGVMQLARAAALELAPLGITCNLIAPGPILTDLTRPVMSGPREALVAGRVPLGRVGRPDDLVGAALFLAGDESAFVTGATLFVDGGRTLG